MLAQVPRTRWGGVADGSFQSTCYFRIAQRGGIFWFIDPDGGRFLSKGVNTVRFDQDRIRNNERIPYAEACGRKYGSEAAWRSAIAARLLQWGFNTLGSWSDETVATAALAHLAVTPNLDLGMSFAWERKQLFPDVFDPDFAVHLQQRAHKLCATKREDKNIVGWFIDNELRWGPDWRGPEDLLALFLNLPAASPGHSAAAATADPDTFKAQVAQRYFALSTAAIKSADPNHLVLGCRFAYPPSSSVIEAAGRHADVVSFNCYEFDATKVIGSYAGIGKPCLIGEFSFRAADSGLPNTNGAGPVVPSQAERAASFRRYVIGVLHEPAIVGFHWFEHADQPAEGRFDGENSNFGIVSIDDHPYEELTLAMTLMNAEAEALHASTTRVA